MYLMGTTMNIPFSYSFSLFAFRRVAFTTIQKAKVCKKKDKKEKEGKRRKRDISQKLNLQNGHHKDVTFSNERLFFCLQIANPFFFLILFITKGYRWWV